MTPPKPDINALTLSIVRLDHSISQIDRPIADAATSVLDDLSCSTPSVQALYLEAPTSNSSTEPIITCPTALRQKVEKSIMRYRRDPDRWTSLTSLLLKSLAFYRSIDPCPIGISPSVETQGDDTLSSQIERKLDITERKLPIIDLPRTKHNRPYLPLSNGKSCPHSSGASDQENVNSMMNVSHQYPWVCMTQQHQQVTCSSKEKEKSSNLLGLDVVIFDARLSKYSPTVADYLKSFVQSFTPWEWKRINYCKCNSSSRSVFGRNKSNIVRSDPSKLREFFLRWSMKEAYTKALGLGMYINFDEFETRLYGIDLDANMNTPSDREDKGIWTSILRTQGDESNNNQNRIDKHQFSVIGKAKRINSLVSWEFWEFIFVPLGEEYDSASSSLPSDRSSYNACACICRGPLTKIEADSESERVCAAVESLTLTDLIQLHGSDPL